MRTILAAWGIGLAVAPFATAQKPKLGSTQGDSVIERGLTASSGGILTLDLASGGSVSIRGWSRDSVRVLAHLAGRDWRDTKVHLGRRPDGIELHTGLGGSSSDKSTSHHFEIWVPRLYGLELQSSGGGVSIANVVGRFHGQTDGGSIELDSVRGEADLATRGGNIRIYDSHLAGRVTTRGGAVELLGVTGGVRTSVESDEVPGDKAGGVRRIKIPGGPIRVGRSEGAVDASTGSGDIDIGPTSGSVRAITGMGNVTVTLARNLRGAESAEITSGSGSVVLELPDDFEGVLDLQAGYTEQWGRPSRIQSDWRLSLQTTGLLANGGTPQRYVRGAASVGAGKSRITVRTTNGDILVRRSR